MEHNKAFRDENYARLEYRNAQKWLNIISMDPEHVHVDEIESKVNEYAKKEIEDMKRLIDKQGELIAELMRRFTPEGTRAPAPFDLYFVPEWV